MQSEQPMIEENFRDENRLAEEAITQNNFPEAARILISIVDKDPQNWRAYNNFGILSWAREYWLDAYSMFKKSVSVNPVYVDALTNLFDASLKLKKTDEALLFFKKALEVNPELEEVKAIHDCIVEQGSDIYFSKRALSLGLYSPIIEDAEKELEGGNLYKAMELFLKSNDTEGPSAKAFCGLGIIAFYQNKYLDAFTLFLESIKAQPFRPGYFSQSA